MTSFSPWYNGTPRPKATLGLRLGLGLGLGLVVPNVSITLGINTSDHYALGSVDDTIPGFRPSVRGHPSQYQC